MNYKKDFMKKITSLLTLGLGIVFGINAQTFVSTAPENKNVLLEEFTGIYCGYCPDGHKMAQDLSDANSGDVFLINIHTGNYANPNAGDPDFTTSYGASIASQASVSSYPAGSVNRNVYTGGKMAMSRSYWDQYATQVIGEASYVNVAAKSSIDLNTRVLTVDVEAYYTSSSAAPSNKLNVALLQNNIAGPQSGGATYNPTQILANGDYNHQHMLRHLITGQWGDDIDTTTTGTFISRTYSYTVPNDLNGVTYNLMDLEVLVFVNEGNDNVISANKSSMSYITPPGQSIVDLGASTNMSVSSMCTYNVTPEVTIKNEGSVAVDTFDVSYSLNGGSAVSETVYSSLAPGASTTHQFASITTSGGPNELTFDVKVENYFSYLDGGAGNNGTGYSFDVISQNSIGTTHSEDFESYSFGTGTLYGTDFNNAIMINPDNERLYVVDNAVTNPALSYSLGGHGNSENCVRYDLIGWSSDASASIIFEKVDFSSATNPTIEFTYATTGFIYNGTNYNEGRFEVNVSKDCGANWTNLFGESGSDLQTTDLTTGSAERLYPDATQWETVTLDASSLVGETEVIVEFKASNTNGSWGNALYLDDVFIAKEGSGSGIEDAISGFISTYPNPATDVINVNTASLSYNATIELTDMLGKTISNALVVGDEVQIDVRSLESGIYLLKIVDGKKAISKKVIVE
jgi:hypothetical protein